MDSSASGLRQYSHILFHIAAQYLQHHHISQHFVCRSSQYWKQTLAICCLLKNLRFRVLLHGLKSQFLLGCKPKSIRFAHYPRTRSCRRSLMRIRKINQSALSANLSVNRWIGFEKVYIQSFVVRCAYEVNKLAIMLVRDSNAFHITAMCSNLY